ncbi:DinB family protein [Candidatus Flexifilum breve]|uniref:DinB family protein n=1 Tax=Candidatus Flexifilum breve TaxID=3140694 RepID=UPI0033130727
MVSSPHCLDGTKSVGCAQQCQSTDGTRSACRTDQVRAASLALFANLDAAAWQRQGIASEMVMSVRALAWIIAGHERHHNRSLRDVYL